MKALFFYWSIRQLRLRAVSANSLIFLWPYRLPSRCLLHVHARNEVVVFADIIFSGADARGAFTQGHQETTFPFVTIYKVGHALAL